VTSTILNIAIALLLAVYAIRNKSASSLFFSLFLYVTFHYSYAALPVFSPFFNIDEFEALHRQTQAGVKLVGFGFLFFILGLLIKRNRRRLFSGIHNSSEKWIGTMFLLWGFMVFVHWVVDAIGGEYPAKIALQDIFSSFLMVIFSWGFGSVLQTQQNLPIAIQGKACRLLLAVLSLMVAIGMWEILSFRAYSGSPLDSGEYVRRANSLLFNPNVLGFWCAFVTIFAAFTFHSNMWPRKLSVLIIVLAGYGILLSGSRSGLIICLFLLGIASLLLFTVRKRIPEIATFRPLLIFVTGIGTIGLFLEGLDKVTGSTVKSLHAMALLVDRFIAIPLAIVSYTFSKLSLFDGYNPSSLSENKTSLLSKSEVRQETTAIAIEGRLNADDVLVDNGYLAMLHDGGWPAFVIWIALWAVFVVLGLQSLRKSPGVNSAYALSLVVGCAFSAMFMRAFQVFPFWVMIAMALGISLSWFIPVLQSDSQPKDK